MRVDSHGLPGIIPLELQWPIVMPEFRKREEWSKQPEFQSPNQLKLNLPAGWPFSLPTPLLLNRSLIPYSVTFRQAIWLLQLNNEKRRLIRAIQLSPMRRPFYLLTELIFNQLERIFPPSSAAGFFIQNIRRNYG